jgi:thiamine monophosphate kinase
VTRRRTIDVPCTVEVESSAQWLHAHVELEGLEIEPGDSVLVHDAPGDVASGQRVLCHRRATVVRAGRLRRAWTRLSSLLELGELLEVGFSSRRTR